MAIARVDPAAGFVSDEVAAHLSADTAVGSAFLARAFIVLSVLVALGIIWNVYLAGRGLRESHRRTWLFTGVAIAGTTAWMALTWYVASTGILADFSLRLPPMLVLFIVILTMSVAIANTRYGTRFVEGLPLWILIAGQCFRLPLEVLMHRAAHEGVMPTQMTYTGWNFDIVTGITALPVAWWLARGHRHARTVAIVWNTVGAILLANILTIAMLSTPLVAAFGPERLNVWVAHPPYVWLPTLLVVCAITSHLVIYRKLRATATRRP
jgi:hypothetical protein